MSPDEMFAAFWQEYPRRVAKKAAEKAYWQAIRSGVTHAQIMNQLRTMKVWEWKKRPVKYIPYAATFLHSEAFQDRCELLEDEGPSKEVTRIIAKEWDDAVEELRQARLK